MGGPETGTPPDSGVCGSEFSALVVEEVWLVPNILILDWSSLSLLLHLFLSSTDVCGRADIVSMNEPATVTRYTTHHVYDHPPYKSWAVCSSDVLATSSLGVPWRSSISKRQHSYVSLDAEQRDKNWNQPIQRSQIFEHLHYAVCLLCRFQDFYSGRREEFPIFFSTQYTQKMSEAHWACNQVAVSIRMQQGMSS